MPHSLYMQFASSFDIARPTTLPESSRILEPLFLFWNVASIWIIRKFIPEPISEVILPVATF